MVCFIVKAANRRLGIFYSSCGNKLFLGDVLGVTGARPAAVRDGSASGSLAAHT